MRGNKIDTCRRATVIAGIEIRTAGKPASIELKADRPVIRPDGKDLSFITVCIKDKNGNPVPEASNRVKFTLTGEGIIAGTDNGYQADTTSLKSNIRSCWKGMGLVIIQSTGKKGNITLKASSPGLPPTLLTLKTAL